MSILYLLLVQIESSGFSHSLHFTCSDIEQTYFPTRDKMQWKYRCWVIIGTGKNLDTQSNQWNLPLLISQVGKNKPNPLCFMSDARIHLYAHMHTAIYVCLYGHMNGKRGREKGGMQVTVYIILLILLYFSVSLFIASFFSLLILSWYSYSNNMLPL